ncbi:hypothetical protein [Paracoccus thiocyanatus]|uniref:Uncharacterized protein n=1 Tax=Paracoccus thiocyanatus TaxID=34006 RepID=A0A3D8PFZ4_9RHOB|nr:hypothetical protein [Paracoccus thiocyanatus]RDW14139.1 hypothetical protein DIE28_04145 [Paracoccus thiocyanatus]
MKNTVAVSAAALILSAGATFAQTTIVTQPSVEATEVQTDPQTTGSGAVGGATTGAVAGGIVGRPGRGGPWAGWPAPRWGMRPKTP